MKTLVIHPEDKSTDFLKPIYQNIENKTVIVGGKPDNYPSINDVRKMIKEHDRVIMLGHGCPQGLFSVGKFSDSYGLIISDREVELLKEKTDNIYIWCNADQYVERNELKGFYSGMFISEVGEAYYCLPNYDFSYNDGHKKRDLVLEEVTKSNNQFAEILGKYVNLPSSEIQKLVTKEYGELSLVSKIAEYNNSRLKVL